MTKRRLTGRTTTIWTQKIGSQITAAMLDRLVHHAEVVSLKDDSDRLKDRDLGRVPAASNTND